MNNHIGDINKMVSETPRTDRWIKNINGWHYVEVERSRELERELSAANERISKLADYVAALETAGDEMANELSYGYDVDLWHKAKEAKP
jgi:hypothetical protein